AKHYYQISQKCYNCNWKNKNKQLHETQRHNQGENSNVEQDSRNANTGHEQEQDSPGIRNQQRDGKQLSVNG
ncbi:MAG: hypothetical protein MJZ17_12015, partial [Bacteroidales bacterium]|nr:hypothetical protein [Bacteroidales bacterium]